MPFFEEGGGLFGYENGLPSIFPGEEYAVDQLHPFPDERDFLEFHFGDKSQLAAGPAGKDGNVEGALVVADDEGRTVFDRPLAVDGNFASGEAK